MRRFLQWLLKKPVTWMANKVSSSPKKKAVFSSLDMLLNDINTKKSLNSCIIPFETDKGKFVIVSDQHKGGRDFADDFRLSEKNYLAALDYYYTQNFTLISAGDSEELWENTPPEVIEKNRLVLLEEAKFLIDDRYYRLFGNHDLEWKYDFPRNLFLKPLFGEKLKVVEGVLLKTSYNQKEYSILVTHGHQGDQKSDGNPFSTWVVQPCQGACSSGANTNLPEPGLFTRIMSATVAPRKTSKEKYRCFKCWFMELKISKYLATGAVANLGIFCFQIIGLPVLG